MCDHTFEYVHLYMVLHISNLDKGYTQFSSKMHDCTCKCMPVHAILFSYHFEVLGETWWFLLILVVCILVNYVSVGVGEVCEGHGEFLF